jgi:hypothetical protein
MTGMKSWERKSALNEALWREVNERIDEVDEAMRVLPDDAQLTFHCECGEEGCTTMISLTPAEYQDVRKDVDRFAISPGHEHPTIERVVQRTDRYVVVDKLPDAEPMVGGDGLPDSSG